MIRIIKVKSPLWNAMRERWANWSFLERLSVVSAIAGFIGLIPTFYPLFPSKPEEPVKAYNLSQSRRQAFLELLRTTQTGPRDALRIGCVQWSETSCLAAGKFLQLFSEAGWKIDKDRVHRMEPNIPVDGMTIATRGNETQNLDKLPPHLGRWSRMNLSQIVILIAFRYMDNPVLSSIDPSLPPQTLGIYFGPEPLLNEIFTPDQKIVRKPLIDFFSRAANVETVCATNQNERCKSMLISWENDIEKYLKIHQFESAVINEWKNLSNTAEQFSASDIERQKNLLIRLILGLR